MPRKTLTTFELKLGYLMPVFFVLGVLINLGITSSPRLALQGFAEVMVRPASFADYSRDPADLIFPAIDPEIIGEVINDSINYQAGQAQTVTPTSNSVTASSTNLAGSPTPSPNSTLPSGATSTLPFNPTATSAATLQASPTQFIPIDGILTLVPTLTPLPTLAPLPTLISTLAPLPTLPPLFTLVPTLIPLPALDLSLLTPTLVCLPIIGCH